MCHYTLFAVEIEKKVHCDGISSLPFYNLTFASCLFVGSRALLTCEEFAAL